MTYNNIYYNSNFIIYIIKKLYIYIIITMLDVRQEKKIT